MCRMYFVACKMPCVMRRVHCVKGETRCENKFCNGPPEYIYFFLNLQGSKFFNDLKCENS